MSYSIFRTVTVIVLVTHFLARWTESMKSYYTTPGIGVGIGGGSAAVGKMLKFVCSSFLCDGQGAVRRAILSLCQVLFFFLFFFLWYFYEQSV